MTSSSAPKYFVLGAILAAAGCGDGGESGAAEARPGPVQPSTPGGGDAPGDRPPVDAPAMSLALTPRVEAWLTLPDGLTPIALDASPPELVASIEDRQLVVQPLRGVAGAFDVTVSATDAAGAPRSLLVRLEVEAGPWAFVEGVPWRARIAPSDAAALDPSRSSSELWASLSPSSTGGTP